VCKQYSYVLKLMYKSHWDKIIISYFEIIMKLCTSRVHLFGFINVLDSWFRASWFIVNKQIQLDATVRRHLFTAKLIYMFRSSLRPSSRVLKTVTATSGIGHNIGVAASFQRGLIRRTLERSSCTNIMTYTRGSGYSFKYSWWWAQWWPKHVDWLCSA
jgi:hypothetical protein